MPELSNHHCFDVFHLLNDSILIIDDNDIIQFYNDSFTKIFEIIDDDILELPYQNFINTKIDLKTVINRNISLKINDKKKYFNIRTFKHNFLNSPKTYILIIFVEYESDKKMKEFKNNLFKEMNEQIKNNLQLIYSLLGLELYYASESDFIDHNKLILNVQQKIVSMSVVYDMLYKTESKEIDIAILLKTICNKFYPNFDIEVTDNKNPQQIHKNSLIHFAIGFAEILKNISSNSKINVSIYKDKNIFIDINSDNINMDNINTELLSGLMSEVNSSVDIISIDETKKLIRIETKENAYGKQ